MTLRISKNLTLPDDAVTETFAILAKRGMGKTYTAAVMAEEMIKAGFPCVVIDPIGVWHGLRSSADGKSEGLPVAILGGEHGDIPLEPTGGTVVAEMVVENPAPIVIDLSLFSKAGARQFMTAFLTTLYQKNRNSLHVFLDEADEWAPQRAMHGAEKLLGACEDLVRRGRARGLGVTMITQRPAVINKDVLTQVEVLIALRTIGPQDRAAIDLWTKVHGTDEQRKTFMSELASLPIGTAYFWSPGWLDIFKKVEVRKRETFDSSSTPKVGSKKIEPRKYAQVDLGILQSRMAETIERSKADDPKELRKRITVLEKQLKNQEPEIIEVEIEKEIIPEWIGAAVVRAMDDLEEIKEMVTKGLPKPVSKRTALIREQQKDTTKKPTAVMVSRGEPNNLSKCERAILTVLCQFPNGRSKTQLGMLSGYSSKSGGFNNSLSKLRSSGFITTGSPIQATDEGVTELDGAYESLPSGSALLDYWLNRLSKSERTILSALVEQFPNTPTKDELGELTDYSSTSGGFNNALSRLRTLELINGLSLNDEFADSIGL